MEIVSRDGVTPFITLDGSEIREYAHPRNSPATAQSLAEATVPVGGCTLPHHHVLTEELYLFVAGRGTLRLGDESAPVRSGDCVVIPPGVVHGLVNDGDEPLVLLCCCAPAYSHGDTVLEGDADGQG